MKPLIAQFMEESQRRRANPKLATRPYPKRLRAAAIEYGTKKKMAGTPYAQISRELRVSLTTVRAWLGEEESKFKSVRINTQPQSSKTPTEGRLCIVTPHGYRLEGLDLNSATALLREFG